MKRGLLGEGSEGANRLEKKSRRFHQTVGLPREGWFERGEEEGND